MPKSIRLSVVLITVVVSFSAAMTLPVLANDGEAVYRCRVLGDISACSSPRMQEALSACEQVAGPYAQYLMFLGRSRAQAIEAARSVGESPAWRIAEQAEPRQLTGEAAHERYLGRSSPPAAQLVVDEAYCTVRLAH